MNMGKVLAEKLKRFERARGLLQGDANRTHWESSNLAHSYKRGKKIVRSDRQSNFRGQDAGDALELHRGGHLLSVRSTHSVLALPSSCTLPPSPQTTPSWLLRSASLPGRPWRGSPTRRFHNLPDVAGYGDTCLPFAPQYFQKTRCSTMPSPTGTGTHPNHGSHIKKSKPKHIHAQEARQAGVL